MLYHKCKALLAEQVSGRGKTAGEIHGKGISQVPPHFVDPERATGYFTFQVCNSSADPGWICPWNHDPPAPAHSLSKFYSFTPLRVQKDPSIQEEKSCKNLHYSPMHTLFWVLEYFLLDKSKWQICLFKNYYLIAMKTSCQLIFPLSDESKTTKKSVGGTALAHFLFLCPQPCPGNLLSMGHRNILSFPWTWAWRKFHLLSPLSLYFQVQDVEFLDFF